MGVLSEAELSALLGAVARPVDGVSVEPVKAKRIGVPAEILRARTAVARQRGAQQLSHPDYPDASQHWFWDIAGTCEAPVYIQYLGEGHPTMEQFRAGAVHPQAGGARASRWEPMRSLWQRVRCRNCQPCLAVRGDHWSEAALDEHRTAFRTWFGTLTFSPAERFLAVSEVRKLLSTGGQPATGDFTTSDGRELKARFGPPEAGWDGPLKLKTFDELTGPERYRLLHRQLGPLVTKFVKRLRAGETPKLDEATGKKSKRVPLRFRFLLTVEPHIWKSEWGPMPIDHVDWFPHYHMLVHEVSGLAPVRKTHLEACWPHGLMRWRLVHDEQAVIYVAKYLSKYSMARVRASVFYGDKVKFYGDKVNINTTVLNHKF